MASVTYHDGHRFAGSSTPYKQTVLVFLSAGARKEHSLNKTNDIRGNRGPER